ncbi:hypothetical protein H8957_009791 [Semnopithecus entellus]
MRYVASYLLAALGGNSSPSAKDIKKILDSVGIEADDDRLNKVAAALAPQPPTLAYGGSIYVGCSVLSLGPSDFPVEQPPRLGSCSGLTSLLSIGIGKLASVPAGGAVAVSAAPGSAAPAAGSAPAAAEEKKDEKKEESEESDDDMGFGLFD